MVPATKTQTHSFGKNDVKKKEHTFQGKTAVLQNIEDMFDMNGEGKYVKKTAVSCSLKEFIVSDLPRKTDCHGDIIITGVESEEVEGINEAYEDLLLELGNYILV